MMPSWYTLPKNSKKPTYIEDKGKEHPTILFIPRVEWVTQTPHWRIEIRVYDPDREFAASLALQLFERSLKEVKQ